MSQKVQQLDNLSAPGTFGVIPKHVPGRMNTDDFVFFSYPSSFPAREYYVVVTTEDTSGGPLRQLSFLEKNVELPQVQFGAHGKIFLIPVSNPNLPTYFARLNRASTYTVSDIPYHSRPGTKIEMTRHGVLTSGVQDFTKPSAY